MSRQYLPVYLSHRQEAAAARERRNLPRSGDSSASDGGLFEGNVIPETEVRMKTFSAFFHRCTSVCLYFTCFSVIRRLGQSAPVPTGNPAMTMPRLDVGNL